VDAGVGEEGTEPDRRELYFLTRFRNDPDGVGGSLIILEILLLADLQLKEEVFVWWCHRFDHPLESE